MTTFIVATAALALLVVALLVWRRTQRVVTTPAQRAVHQALHTASLAAVPLRRGLTEESASEAAPHLRALAGAEALGVADAEGTLLAWDGPQTGMFASFADAARRAVADERPVLVTGDEHTLIAQPLPIDTGAAVGVPALERVDLSSSKFLIYGLALVSMMLIRPEGVFPSRQRQAELHSEEGEGAGP